MDWYLHFTCIDGVHREIFQILQYLRFTQQCWWRVKCNGRSHGVNLISWHGVTFKKCWIFSSLLLHQFTWKEWARSPSSHIKQRIASRRVYILRSMFWIWSNGFVHSTAGFYGSWSPLPCSHQPAVGPVMSHINQLRTFLLYFFKILSNIILPSTITFSKWSLSFGF
jgi:hypothetical protein